MNIEIDKEALDKIKKGLRIKENKKRRNIKSFSLNKINRSYYVLLVFMIGLASLSIYTKSEKSRINSVLEENVAPALSNNYTLDQSGEASLQGFEKEMPKEISSPLDKSKIKSAEYNDGIIKIETIGDEKVLNIADGGVVENIYLDYSYGYTVVISYSDNIKCKYYNLNSDIYVTFNQNLKKGDIIGRSVEYSLMDESYIYLSVYYKNEAIDIRSVIGI